MIGQFQSGHWMTSSCQHVASVLSPHSAISAINLIRSRRGSQCWKSTPKYLILFDVGLIDQSMPQRQQQLTLHQRPIQNIRKWNSILRQFRQFLNSVNDARQRVRAHKKERVEIISPFASSSSPLVCSIPLRWQNFVVKNWWWPRGACRVLAGRDESKKDCKYGRDHRLKCHAIFSFFLVERNMWAQWSYFVKKRCCSAMLPQRFAMNGQICSFEICKSKKRVLNRLTHSILWRVEDRFPR